LATINVDDPISQDLHFVETNKGPKKSNTVSPFFPVNIISLPKIPVGQVHSKLVVRSRATAPDLQCLFIPIDAIFTTSLKVGSERNTPQLEDKHQYQKHTPKFPK
jgi:hypothetical protein